MSVPSMVHRSGDSLIVRSVVSGDALFGSADDDDAADEGADEYGGDADSSSGDPKDLPECKVKRNYSCNSCDFFTQNPRHFLYHLRDVHEEKVRIYECPNCLYASKHFQKLLRHTKMVHGSSNNSNGGGDSPRIRSRKNSSTVAVAIAAAAAAAAAPSHAEEADDAPLPPDAAATSADDMGSGLSDEEASGERASAVFKCSVCAFTARTQAQLGRHEREEHIKTKFFRCTKCTYVTHMKARFTKHVKYHSMPMIKCDMCDFRTPYKWNLDRHCKNHNGRGAFRCSACNFTADIKQSLTVHEMNHHVPPVGQAAGLGVGRRRNKVGASDATAAEEAARQQQEQVASAARSEPAEPSVKAEPEQASSANIKIKTEAASSSAPPAAKKAKIVVTQSHASPEQGSFGPDFLNPDDIIHHANGNIYIKNKCKLCNFKSAWDSEMAKHEKKAHNIVRETSPKPVNKKPTRPIPNLIPIPAPTSVLKPKQPKPPAEPMMSQQDINDICAKSANSSLKDFASLFGSEDVFENNHDDASATTPKMPDLLPAFSSSTPKRIGSPLPPPPPPGSDFFKQKNASFFDKLKEKLMTGVNNLICKYCGYESKCLTEQAKHKKQCGNEINLIRKLPASSFSSSRCQYCRQRCKSSADLYTHMQTCREALKTLRDDDESDDELKIDETQSEDGGDGVSKPHPMENRVFVWNNIEVPMDIDEAKYAEPLFAENEKVADDNVSLDLSVRTQSPVGSENSFVQDYVVNTSHPTTTNATTTTDKIPTHGNDISVAQHKRVFKCPHCTFWASTASRFHVHIVGHLNKKPFECSLCAYRSNWRWDITKHIKLKSVRDPAHESAKVLMTDETGRRNYTKYNKYLTEIHVSGDQTLETSGGSGTRPKHHDRNHSPQSKADLPKLTRAPNSSDFSPLLRTPPLRPPPPLKAADGFFDKLNNDKKNKQSNNADNKRTLFKCKKCNFRDASREILLAHVKGHYPQGQGGGGSASSSSTSTQEMSFRGASPDKDEASVSTSAKGSQAPFRCGHCNQVSNWKHVIQRHCRLKHSGDIRVVSNKNGQERLEVEEQTDEPDHIDVPQDGTFKCPSCPYSSDLHADFKEHLTCHSPGNDSVMKCHYCNFFVSKKEDLLDHFRLHGIDDPEDFLYRILERNSTDGDMSKRFKCLICPYVTNSKSQYTYHKQFHKPRGGQYTCSHCSYNVSKRHLLHQHLKVHGINLTPQKQNGDVIDLDEISDEIEEVSTSSATFETQQFSDIPLVWVSKSGKFSKMFKCRHCPHVNLRKVNIQEHEKMHSIREKNPNSSRLSDVEHHCSECNYVCNNAGVLSSHSKVHQGFYGTVHCLVDHVKSDEEQIRELSKFINPNFSQIVETINLDDFEHATAESVIESEGEEDSSPILYFCQECPARFLKDNEYEIHTRLHGVRLFYKCSYCSYSARQKPHLLAHNKVHTGEYQDRTRVLQTMYMASNTQPQTYSMGGSDGDTWVVFDNKADSDIEIEQQFKPIRSTTNVPLSGTELFAQKSEAQLKLLKDPSPPPPKQHSDPQFGTLMHGNPEFIYPTYLKNGRMKEKRYKCHKCPSAFEKREQYKVHLNLHGSKQRYRCEHCDYSVKYYANYVQHLKKHKMNSDALAARQDGPGIDEMEEMDDCGEEVTSEVEATKLSLGDQQTYKILQQRLVNNPSPVEAEKKFSCPSCPYMNHRKDAVDNHHKRHVSVSGVKNSHTCEHCDYSVPQAHFLKDHTKLHFTPKVSQIDGYMVCDNLKLISSKTSESDDDDNSSVIFEENQKEFLPPLSDEVTEKFNNNDGEKQFVSLESGDVVALLKNGDKFSSIDKMDES